MGRVVLDDGTCDRCKHKIADFTMPVGGLTSGYYLVTCETWREYGNKGEQIVCDDCMWHDPRYRRDYRGESGNP